MRRRRGIVAALAGLVLALAGCGAPAEPARSDIFRIGTTSGIDSMNPFVGINEDGYSAWMHMYPTLLQYDTSRPGLPYRPSLAESWKLAPDGLSLTFTIRQGARWSDGTPLDASDAAWSLDVFHRYNDSAAAAWSVGSSITSVTAPNARTLVLRFKERSALSLYDVATTPLLPEQVWGPYATGDGSGLKTFDNTPSDGRPMVGGGPFLLERYRQGETAIFTANPHWYGDKPSIRSFGLQTFRAPDAMITALASGGLDAALGVPPTGLPALQSAGIQTQAQPALALRDLIINSNPDKPAHRELLDRDVRRAMEHAVDRKEIAEVAWVGKATPGGSVLPPVSALNGQNWHNSRLQTVSFDLDEARRILDRLGFARGEDGVRLAHGHRMEYEVMFSEDEKGPGDRAFQIIKQDFESIGIRLAQRKLDASATWDAIYCGDDCAYRDFDLAMWNWHPAPDPDFLMSSLTCEQWGSWNDTGYCDKEFDSLNARQKRTLNPAERKKLIDQMQQKIYDDRPYIVLTYDERIDAWSRQWTGLVPSSQGFFNNRSTQSMEAVRRR